MKLKIISWNCNGAFRKKANIILELAPDVLIVPECEHPDKLKFENGTRVPNGILWYGENVNKGLGVFSYGDYELKLLDCHNRELKTILPIAVKGGKLDFTLFAIWANNEMDKRFQYIGQVWKAVQHYNNLLKNDRTILIGDFNSNKIWDKKHRVSNHSNVVEILEKKGIYSTYHKYFSNEHGKEEHPTLFMYRNPEKPYHINYLYLILSALCVFPRFALFA